MYHSSQLGLLPEDSRASLLVWPGSDRAKAMTVGSGRKWSMLLTESSRIGCWLKMCLESSGWNSTNVWLTWKTLDTPRKRLLFQLVPSMPRIDEAEFGLWPTPTASVANGGQTSRSGSRKQELLLTGLARMWPTPDANSGKRFGQNPKKINPKRQFTINDAARLWSTPPTPTQDAHNNGGQSQHNRNTTPLNAVAGGSLNPNWVEWLMGYPIGWTDLED